MVQLARLNAERHGAQVEIARNGEDLLRRAHANPPNLIVLGDDLTNPSSDDLMKILKLDPNLRGVEVVVMKGLLPDLLKAKSLFRWPGAAR